MSLFTRFVLIACAAALLASCGSNTGPADVSGTDMVTTTIVGHVVDAYGSGVQGAVVRAHGATASTNDDGVFVMRDVRVPADRCVVHVRNGGQVDGWRAAVPSPDKVTMLRLTMQAEYEQGTIWAPNGGYVARGNAKMQVLAQGAETMNGSIYEHRISVSLTYHATESDTFYRAFPGDLAGRRSDGSRVEIECLGAMTVKICDNNGQPLRLRKEHTGGIWFPAGTATQDSMPLWRLDETQGLWIEDGVAYRVENTYVGVVAQFGTWCIGLPSVGTAVVEGRVTCGDASPLSGVVVTVGQAKVITDEDGVYRRRIPAGTSISVGIDAGDNLGVAVPARSIGPVAADQRVTQDINVAPCPTIYAAQLVDCSDRPSGGIIRLSYATGIPFGGGNTIVSASVRGDFRIIVPADKDLYALGVLFDGAMAEPWIQPAIPSNTSSEVAVKRACDVADPPFVDVRLPNIYDAIQAIDINADGTSVAAVSAGFLYLVDISTGSVLWKAPVTDNLSRGMCYCRFVANEERVVVVSSAGQGAAVYDRQTGQVLAASSEAIAFTSADGSSFLSHNRGGNGADIVVRRYDGRTTQLLKEHHIPNSSGTVEVLGLLGNDIIVTFDHTTLKVNLYDLRTGAFVRSVALQKSWDGRRYLSRSGRMLATDMAPGMQNQGIGVYDLQEGRLLVSSEALPVGTVTFSPDDQLMFRAQTLEPYHTRIEVASTLEVRRELRPMVQMHTYNAVTAFSGRGEYFAFVVQDAFARDPLTGKRRFSVRIYDL